MTRLRNKKPKQDKEDAALGPSQPKPKVKYDVLPPKGPGFIESFLSENWKQQSMVKKGSNYTVLTTIMLILQIAASVGLIAFAGTRVSPSLLFVLFVRQSSLRPHRWHKNTNLAIYLRHLS